MSQQAHTCSIARFEAMISPYPEIARFWKFDGLRSILTLVDDSKVYINQHERLLFRFFRAVWTQEPSHIAEFNYIEAAYMFEGRERKLFLDFLAEPFLPG